MYAPGDYAPNMARPRKVEVGEIEDNGIGAHFRRKGCEYPTFLPNFIGFLVKEDRGPTVSIVWRQPGTHMLPRKSRVSCRTMIQ